MEHGGNIIMSESSATQDNQVTLNEYGSYLVIYTLMDSEGNDIEDTKLITVPDETAPVIHVDDVPATAKLGGKFVIPQPTISDNVSQEYEMRIYVVIVAPSGIQTYVHPTGAYKWTEEGVHSVRFLAIDAAGNTALLEYKVRVS